MSSSLFAHVRSRIDPLGLAWTDTSEPSSVPRVAEDDYLSRLGAAIQSARKALKLSQAELGERVGRDANSISRWERGATSLSAYDLVQLWRALDVDAEWLLEPTDSISELERRAAQLRRAALEAARDDVAEASGQRASIEGAPRRGKR